VGGWEREREGEWVGGRESEVSHKRQLRATPCACVCVCVCRSSATFYVCSYE